MHDINKISQPYVSLTYLKKKKTKKYLTKTTKIQKQDQSHVGCKCKNSNCLRLHCSCFKTLGYCSD